MRNRGLVLLLLLIAGCRGKHSDLYAVGTPFGPTSDAVHLTIGFTRPMVAKAELGKPVARPPVATEPAIDGEARWLDDHTLTVFPKKPLPVSTQFKVTVPAATKALDGTELGEDYTYAFSTERLTAELEVLGVAERASPDQTIRATFNQRVPLATVLASCKLTGAGKSVLFKNAPQSPSGPAESYMLQPVEPLGANTAWSMTCAAGMMGTVGNLGLAYDVVRPLHTFGPLVFKGFQQAGKPVVPDESVRLALVFSNPLAAPFKLKLEPPAPGFPQTCHTLDDAEPGVVCTPALDAQVDYTLTVDASQTDTAGQPLGKPAVIKFHTVDARPGLSVESGYFIAELKRPQLPLWTRNLSAVAVRAVQITPDNFFQLQPVLNFWAIEQADLKTTKLAAKTLTVPAAGTKNKWQQHPLGAAELFGGAAGPGMFYVELGSKELNYPPFQNDGVKKILVNFTDIGAVTKMSGARGMVWATRLSTGKPLAGATVTVRGADGKPTFTGTTDADGVALLPGTAALMPKHAAAASKDGLDTAGEHYAQEGGGGDLASLRVFVSAGNDFTMVNPSRSNGLAVWNFNVAQEMDDAPVKLRGFMHTDRGLYRPGETVHVKGLARATKLGSPLDVPGEGRPVKVTVSGPTGKSVLDTTVTLSPFGGFWFDVELPGDARLGDYAISARLDNGDFTRAFTVEEYRPATYEVTAKAKTARVVGDGAIEGEVAATYFYGAPLRGGDVEVTVHARGRRVEFPGFEAYSFVDARKYEGYHDESELSQQMVTEDHVKLDDKGVSPVHVTVGPNDLTHDADLLIQTNVTSPSNEVISKSFSVPYFHASTYFGVQFSDYFMDAGKPQKITAVAVGADGKPATTAGKLTIYRRDWNCVWEDWGYRGNYNCKEQDKQIVGQQVSFAGKPVTVDFTPDDNGEYWAVVEGDAKTQPSATRLYAWGGSGGSWQSSDSMTLEVVADKKEYKAGDTATLLLKTDLAQATGLMTIERDGVIEKKLITVDAKTKRFTVPITAAMAPNMFVSFALVQGRMGEGDRGKPRMRMGIVNLPVRPADNRLTVTVESDKKEYRPGEQVTATVKVVDGTGAPVSAEVSITAADEGVLSLIGYETPDPIPTFYAGWGLGVSTAAQFEYIRDIPGPNQERPATGGDAVGTFRSRFVSTAVWAPAAVTDANGIATVTFAAPDNLTAFRMMTLAADRGHRFGSADRRFTVSKPLQLHEALPRFALVGDVFQGGVVLHNESGKAGTATVTISTDAHLKAAGGLERTFPIGKGEALPVWFQLSALSVGTTKLAFTATMDGEKDAVIFELPVEHPSPLRTDPVTGGVATAATSIKVPLPPDAMPGTVELVMSVDPDGLSGLENGLSELVEYPYGCLEQTTSKLVPMLAARELAEGFGFAGITGPALDRFVKAGVTKIGKHQTPYGGFSLWPGGDPDTYLTAYALWGLYLAEKAGFSIDAARTADALAYLRNADTGANKQRPNYYEYGDLGDRAFALFVRAAMGDKTAQPMAAQLLTNVDLPIYGRAFVARAVALGLGAKDPVVQKMIAQLSTAALAATRAGKLVDEPNAAHLYAYMSSSKRTTAAVLWALVELDPKNAAIRPLVDTLMKARNTDRWWDTQANAFSLLSLGAYAKTLSPVPSSVSVVVGGQPLITGALAGKQRMRLGSVPLTAATEVQLTPSGEVHYQVGVRYRKQLAALKTEAHGLKLTNVYLDEAGKPKLQFKVGDIVRVQVSVDAASPYDNEMISAVLPAGFEPLNARFKTVGADVVQTNDWGVYSEMHDDRVDFATTYAYGGSRKEEFMARATTAGTFVVPPTRGELMYQPEVFARTAASTIVIEAK